MLETVLTTRAEIQKYKQLANSSYDAKLNQVIIEAQLQDLKPLLGERLFNDVLKDVSDTGNTDGTIYTALLNGGEYTEDGCTYYNPGIKAVLANYVYGRLVMWGDVVDNPFGMTHKLNSPDSKPVDFATKKSFYNENQSFAYNLFLEVRRFLILTDVALYRECYTTSRKSFKITKIGSNNRRRHDRNK